MNATEIEIRPLSANVGAEVVGVDAREPLPQELATRLREAWHKYGLLLLREQQVNESEQLRFATAFGDVSTARNAEKGYNYVSNIDEDGRNPYGELGFHFDNSFMPAPLLGLMLYAIEVPPAGEGGDTLFADVRLAYRSLPPELREKIAGLTIRHGNPDKSKHEGLPGLDTGAQSLRADHPLVGTHPATGEPFLFLSRRHADRILDLSPEQSAALIEELTGYLYQPAHIFQHAWKPGDLVVWDNLALQHGRTNFDPKWKRHLRRIQIGI